jgi:hypothetical protein
VAALNRFMNGRDRYGLLIATQNDGRDFLSSQFNSICQSEQYARPLAASTASMVDINTALASTNANPCNAATTL